MSNLFFINIEISSRIHFKVLGSLYMINLSSKYIKPLRIHSRALKHHLIIWGYIFVLYIFNTLVGER